METKKISFGFSKITQKNIFIPPPPKEENKVELIKCLEGKEIKLVEEPKPKELLVIPMKETGKTSAALASLIKRRAVLNDEAEPEKPPECKEEKNGTVVDQDVQLSENLEQRAARELLSEAKEQDDAIVDTKLILPVLTPDELPLDGAKEPTFDDYESIPIEQFGRAMLRGMGWVDPPPEKESTLPEGPRPRPKGMGLGADTALKPKPLLVQPEKNEVLEIKRKAFVRVLAGKYKDMYGQIEDFDDFVGRIIVRMAIGGSNEVFSEFMCQPVAKKEYEQYSKCINAAKYEAYKKFENEYGQIIIKKDQLKSLETKKTDSGKNLKEYSVEDKKHDRDCEDKHGDKSYERSRDRKGKYKDDDHVETRDSRARSPSDQPTTSSQYYRNQAASSSQDYKDSKAKTSKSRHKKKTDSDSTDTDSCDSDDSAYKRRHKKKSNKSSSRRKSKKSKRKRREFSSATDEDSSDAEKRHKSHKKKTKKSKRERSRSRSRGRR